MQLGHKVWYLLGALIIGLLLLFSFDPEKTAWMPKCPFYVLTGLKCPSCGIQRAAHSLLHLKFDKAIRYNPFLVFAVPYVVSLIIVSWVAPKDKILGLRRLCYSTKTVYFYLFCMIAWWIVRNIIGI